MTENIGLTDSELMLKVGGYDSKALEELYNRYSPILYTLIKRIVGELELAEDILCEVFVIIWKKIDHYDFKHNNVYTWLVTLARNKAVDLMQRKRNPDIAADYTDEYEDEHILPKLSQEIQGLELEKVISMSEQIKDAVNTLTDAQRYVIDLAFYDGYNENEIAEKLKIPLPTVQSKVQVAMDILSQEIDRGTKQDG